MSVAKFQYEAPVIPHSWGPDARQFALMIDENFERVYTKLDKLKSTGGDVEPVKKSLAELRASVEASVKALNSSIEELGRADEALRSADSALALRASTLETRILNVVPLKVGWNATGLNTTGYDLNNMRTIGSYYCNSNATAATFKNAPTALAFRAVVVNLLSSVDTIAAGAYDYFLQLCVDIRGGIYARYVQSSPSELTYGSWNKLTP